MNASSNQAFNSTSNVTSSDQPVLPTGSPTIDDARMVALISSFYQFIVSFVTIVANGLLLFLFFKTPSRWFRQSSCYFLAAIAFADFLNGLVPEPLYASCFIITYYRYPGRDLCNNVIFEVARLSTIVTVNISILIVMAFTITQCVAVMSPLRFAPMVTPRRIIACVAAMWVYVILFEASYHLGMPKELLNKIDMFLNTLGITFTTITLYVLLRRAFRKNLEKSLKLRSADSVHQMKANRVTTNQVERQFVVLNGFLISLYIICFLPNAGYWFAAIYWNLDFTPGLLITSLICDNVMFLKFAMDPFIFAWRLPRYSQELKKILCCHCGNDVEDVVTKGKDVPVNTRSSYITPETEDSKL